MAYKSCITITYYVSRQPKVFYNMTEEQPSSLFRRTCFKSRYKHIVLRKSIHNNKDRFEVTNLWKSIDEIHGNVFPRF